MYGVRDASVDATDYDTLNAAKANFDAIYEMPDPREYVRVLCGLDYVIPDLAKGTFRAAAHALEQYRGRPVKVLDLGCSYGINAALLRYPLDIDLVAQRYGAMTDCALSTAELIELDRHYFRAWPTRPMTLVGLDRSRPAITYATAVGLLDAGLTCDLEKAPPSAQARQMLQGVDLVISTGCVGYVGERTFHHILSAIEGPPPWVLSFVLRMFSFDAIASRLAIHGLVTEKLEGVTFIQRRFHSASECREVLDALAARGIATDGKESEGLYHAELYVSRPADAVADMPLDRVVHVTSGANRAYGQRWTVGADDVLRLAR